MVKGNRMINWLTEELKDSLESVPGQPLVEIAGEYRVLIENHLGIFDYAPNQILINVRFGLIKICGHSMEISKMTKEQIVICGTIQSVSLCRRNKG